MSGDIFWINGYMRTPTFGGRTAVRNVGVYVLLALLPRSAVGSLAGAMPSA